MQSTLKLSDVQPREHLLDVAIPHRTGPLLSVHLADASAGTYPRDRPSIGLSCRVLLGIFFAPPLLMEDGLNGLLDIQVWPEEVRCFSAEWRDMKLLGNLLE